MDNSAEANCSSVNFESLSDQCLLDTARAGVVDAYGVLCERYRKRVFARIRRIHPRHEDCEDAMQEALLLAFRHMHSFREQAAFSTWLTRIAINSALMAVRKSTRSRTVAIGDICEEPERFCDPASHPPTPESISIRKAQRQALQKAIQTLPTKLRSVVEMRVLQDRSVADTARLLGISVPATKSRLVRAKLRLTERLQPRPPRVSQGADEGWPLR